MLKVPQPEHNRKTTRKQPEPLTAGAHSREHGIWIVNRKNVNDIHVRFASGKNKGSRTRKKLST